MAPHPLIDKEAPSFSISDSKGETFKFPPEEGGKDGGKPIVLFFYPESGTYGCTREACQFRDALVEKEIFKRSDVLVVGVSSDPVEKQKAFAEKHNLAYPVLSDTAHVAHKTYHVGKGLLGLTDARTTFVIDQRGIVRGVLKETMNFSAHVKFAIKELEKMQNRNAPQDTTNDPGGGQDQENYMSPTDPAERAEREELGRVADAVGA
ncbi:AhpC-TSA-domain-containing protein [Gyrodon lividus]|nr:AhpC-TSA-domain-containing protein [Gyrodon lividus]